MTSVVSLHENPVDSVAAGVIEALGARLAIEPKPGADGSWEFCFAGTYTQAHAAVLQALADVDPAWPAHVTLEYALAV
jgi:hypothetical protein